MALLSLRMLLESPNPKDPQDAEVAKLMMEDPEYHAVVAHDWAVNHAGAPRRELPPHLYTRKKVEKKPDDPSKSVEHHPLPRPLGARHSLQAFSANISQISRVQQRSD